MRALTLLFFFVVASFTTLSQSADSLIALGKKEFIDSDLLKQKREYWIYLPPSYNTPEARTHRYPVLYLLDGDTYFIPAAGIVDDMGWSMVVPEMIIVAIIHNDRMFDLLPKHTDLDRFGRKSEALKTSGHADDFLKFLEKELFTTIDGKYRTMPYRLLVGHSSAGLTALYALQSNTPLFNAYVAIDPGALENNEFVMNDLSLFLQKNNLSTRKLFISSANNVSPQESWEEVMKPTRNMLGGLEADKHSKIDWKYNHYPNDNHITVFVPTFYDAMRFIFRSWSINSMRDRLDPQKIINQFQMFSDETGVTFTPPEYIMNRLGVEVMALHPLIPGSLDAAIKYFKENLDRYPQSVPSLLNMGDAMKLKGMKAEALSYYKRALAIEPENQLVKSRVAGLK